MEKQLQEQNAEVHRLQHQWRVAANGSEDAEAGKQMTSYNIFRFVYFIPKIRQHRA